jgi:SAM-dependent methyltransferase
VSTRSLKFRDRSGNRYWWFQGAGRDFVPPVYSLLTEEEWKLLEDWYDETDARFQNTGECNVPAMSLLQGLIMGSGIGRVVQLGHFVGYSTLLLGFMMRRIGKHRSVFSIDISPEASEFTMGWIARAGLTEQVEILVSDSADSNAPKLARQYLGGLPEVVFIDSSHGYAHTLAELDLWYPELKAGGLLLLHDVSDFAARFDPHGSGGVIKAAREWLQNRDIPAILLNADARPRVPGADLVYGDACGLGIIQKPLQDAASGKKRGNDSAVGKITSRESRSYEPQVERILLKYFTVAQLPYLQVTGNTVAVGDARFEIDRSTETLQWSHAPQDPWLQEQLRVLPPEQGTWAVVAFLKVRHFDDSNQVIARARTGTLYDEDYYTKRGGGSPYVGYPRQDSGHDTTLHFANLAKELTSRFGQVPVLDAGCATGVLVKMLSEAGCSAEGIDVSAWAVEHAVCQGVRQGSLLDLPYEDNRFNLVISQDVLEHVHPDDLPRALAEQVRVTRSGGHLVHFVPFYSDYPEPVQIDAHLANADRQWWVRLFRSTPGLRVMQEPGDGNQWDYTNGILSRYFVLEVTK